MSIFIQVGDGNRIVGVSEGEAEGFEEFAGELPDEWNDYLLEDGKLVHDEQPWKAEAREAEAKAQERETLLSGLEQYQADTDAALCEIYESADKAQADTDAALCEIYEQLIGEE